MTIIEVTSAYYARQRPRCRACQHYGKDPENQPDDALSAECQLESAPIRNRQRDFNDRACSKFRLADWLKQPDPWGEKTNEKQEE